jgi:hypothetical protein
MLTPIMTPRGSRQLSYLIVGKCLVSQAFQQSAIWPLPIFDHIDLWPSYSCTHSFKFHVTILRKYTALADYTFAGYIFSISL